MITWTLCLWAASGPLEALEGEPVWTAAEVAARALEVAPAVEAARQRQSVASAQAEQAWASVLPRVQVSARYTRLSSIDNDPLVTFPVEPDTLQAQVNQVDDPDARALWQAQVSVLDASVIQIPQNQGAFQARIEYPVTALFLEILPAVRASSGLAEAESIQMKVTEADVELRAVQTYFLHARARAAAAVATQSLEDAETNLDRAEARLVQGLAVRPDVLRFRARRAEALGQVAESQAEVDASAEALRTLLRLESTSPIGIGEAVAREAPARPETTLAELVGEAREKRAEVLALRQITESQQQLERSARGAVAPRLSVAAQVDTARPNALYTPPGDDFRTTAFASVVVEWSPDGAWSASRRAKGARAEVRRLQAEQEGLEDAIRIEVSRAWTRFQASFSVFEAARAQLEAASEAYAARLRGYEVGVADSTELLDASTDLDRARLSAVDAGVEIRLRETELLRALGRSRVPRDSRDSP